MSSLKQVRVRRLISVSISFAIACVVSLPALAIRPDLIAQIYYVGLIGLFVALATWALHHSLMGPMVFSYASVEALGIRRAIDRLVPKTNPVFRVSPKSTNTHVQVEQYLWNGWAEIHQDRQFDSINSMQLYVRDSSARSQPFIGPEFTGDDLLVIDGDDHAQALSMRHADRYTERARDEANQSRRSLWSRRLLYCSLAIGAAMVLGLALAAWRTRPFAGTVLSLTLNQIILGCGILGTVGVVAAFSYATRDTRRRWWHAVKLGTRYVRYRLVREAHEDRYFVQAYSASEWRTKTHINGLDMLEVEKVLENDVREIRRIIAANHAAADARAARERLIAPFKVEATRAEALLHERRNELNKPAPALIALTPEQPDAKASDPIEVTKVTDVDDWAPIPSEPIQEKYFDEAIASRSNVLPIRFGREGSRSGGAHAPLMYPAR